MIYVHSHIDHAPTSTLRCVILRGAGCSRRALINHVSFVSVRCPNCCVCEQDALGSLSRQGDVAVCGDRLAARPRDPHPHRHSAGVSRLLAEAVRTINCWMSNSTSVRSLQACFDQDLNKQLPVRMSNVITTDPTE